MSRIQDWHDIDALPENEGRTWAIWQDHRWQEADFHTVAEKVSRWLPPDPMLIGTPHDTRFVPPVLVMQFEKIALRTVRQNLFNTGAAFGLLGALLLGLAAFGSMAQPVLLGLLLLLLAGMLATDYLVALRYRDGVAERAMFFWWLRFRTPARVALHAWLAFAVGVGALQLMLQFRLGGLEQVFFKYGVMYADVERGELWRLLAGPYLHYSLFHYGNNLVLLALTGALTYALFGGSTIALFGVANVVCAWAQMTFGGRVFDNFGGMSGGIYALAGALIVAGLLNRRLLPKGFGLLCINLTVLGLLSAELLSSSTASVAHLGGLLLGGLAGIGYARCGCTPVCGDR